MRINNGIDRQTKGTLKYRKEKNVMKRKISILTVIFIILLPLLCSCLSGEEEKSVYYLNFKPEVAEVYERIARDYYEETGVKLNVVTAASNTYEQTLKSEIAKADAPAIFQINGPRGYASWRDYCADLKDSKIYSLLSDKGLAITDGEGVYGIPYVVEGYGIIYNDRIMQAYFASPNKQVDVSEVEDINSFAIMSAVVTDMTRLKEELGINGVFASTSLKPGEDWRWTTHLANVPIYYEFKNNDIDLTGDQTREIEFMYSDQFRNIYDLYINNSVTEPKLLGSKQVADSMAEFALGRCAMVQNGNWAWSQIDGIGGNTVDEDEIKFMPIYMGIEGEERQGLCIGTENYLAINSTLSEEKQALAQDFLYWLFTSDTGKEYVTNELNFITPFSSFDTDEVPDDPLAREVVAWMNRDDRDSVDWNFTLFPSQSFKDKFGSSLLAYAQGTKPWNEVRDSVISDWKNESGA